MAHKFSELRDKIRSDPERAERLDRLSREYAVSAGLAPTSEYIERLAAAAHDAWLAEKRRRGVGSWPNERGFEQMVPYAELPEDVREFDRIVVRAMLGALA